MYITRQYVKDHPEKIFIFGDNVLEKGFGGQAKELRGEPNSYGIPTKKYPTLRDNAFFRDIEFENNCRYIDKAIAKIPVDDRELIILPLGTGLADLPQGAPRTYVYLIDALKSLERKVKWVSND